MSSSYLIYRPLICCLISAVVFSCMNRPIDESLYTETDSTETHIGFVNRVRNTDKLNFLDYLYFYNGGGVSAGDINNDGLTDLYFVSNQGKNRLYLNKGNFQFDDITDSAGVGGYSDWQTGVTMADVNGDGLLDIYVCAVSNFKGLEGSNELYINNGDLTFTEKAADFGLDFTGFSTQAAFLDYDKDGDLDMYLLNHAVHTSRSYDRVSARVLKNNEAGDYLFENQIVSKEKASVRFKDVSQSAGIYQAAMGYGLGVAIGDLNNDGWDDIYVSNDFHEDDYYYINNGDGTFTESVKEYFRHLSRFSMGCDIADINNDGYQDVMTLDMYPENETVEKSSAGEDPFEIFIYKLQFGYYNQYSRNCLQLNLSGKKFSDVAALSGVAATDWSWSTLMADYDNDGHKDIFVSNGIVSRPNDLDYIKYIANDSMTYSPEVSRSMTEKAIAMMPDGKVHNYIFRGKGDLKFDDKSVEWGFGRKTISNGAAYADLDNDGDLEIITNNINEAAGIYKNHQEALLKNQFIKIKLAGDGANKFGVGAKVAIKCKGEFLFQQAIPTRGFQSSVEPSLLFGLGKHSVVDTLVVIWNNNLVQVLTNIKANSSITLRQKDALLDAEVFYNLYPREDTLFQELPVPGNFAHSENDFMDFYRETLVPFQLSTEGPKIAVGDVNHDGLDDFYLGGAKWQPGKLFIQQQDGAFTLSDDAVLATDSVYEDVDASFFDADNDADLDLYVVSGGNEFYGTMPQLFDRLYLNNGRGRFTRSNDLPEMFENKSCVRECDYDKDGDLDLFVGGRTKGYQYGIAPQSYLLINDGKGKFTDATLSISPELRNIGMVTDGAWVDYDNDNDVDLVIAGDWMPVTIFENNNNRLTRKKFNGLEHTNGFWQVIRQADFDNDGDIDFVAGNLGLNTKFNKTGSPHLKLWVKDIDRNEGLDHILSYNVDGEWYPVASRDELSKQLPGLKKKFINYKEYAGKPVSKVFSSAELKDALVLEVNMLSSVYIENLAGEDFKVHSLPTEAQVSKIFAMHIEDVDNDNHLDILLGGNFYGVSMYQGRYDASYGLILKGDGNGKFKSILPTQSGFLLEGEVRDIKPVNINNKRMLFVARNGHSVQHFKKADAKEGKPDL